MKRWNRAQLASGTQALLQSEAPGAQEIGAMLFPSAFALAPDELVADLRSVADSQNWEVREWAAAGLGEALHMHFARLRPLLQDWAASPSERLRRAAVIALMEYGKTCLPQKIPAVLDLLGEMLDDPSPYVQTNLGPFALGSALAARAPQAVLDRLRTWVHHRDERVRAQVALVFSAAAGAQLADRATDVLQRLEADSSPHVQRALRKAQRAIERRRFKRP